MELLNSIDVQLALVKNGNDRKLIDGRDPFGPNGRREVTTQIDPRNQDSECGGTRVFAAADKDTHDRPKVCLDGTDFVAGKIEGLLLVLIRQARFPIDPGRGVADMESLPG